MITEGIKIIQQIIVNAKIVLYLPITKSQIQ